MTLRIVDAHGHLVAAAAATAAQIRENASELASTRIAAIATPPQSIIFAWSGFACDRSGTITITDDQSVIVAPDAIPNCELVPNYRGVVLTFREPRLPESVRLTLRDTEILEAS